MSCVLQDPPLISTPYCRIRIGDYGIWDHKKRPRCLSASNRQADISNSSIIPTPDWPQACRAFTLPTALRCSLEPPRLLTRCQERTRNRKQAGQICVPHSKQPPLCLGITSTNTWRDRNRFAGGVALPVYPRRQFELSPVNQPLQRCRFSINFPCRSAFCGISGHFRL